MKQKDFNTAIELISKHHSTTISIRVPITDNVSNVYDLLIHKCCPAVINDLKLHGFSLGMCEKGLYVDKY